MRIHASPAFTSEKKTWKILKSCTNACSYSTLWFLGISTYRSASSWIAYTTGIPKCREQKKCCTKVSAWILPSSSLAVRSLGEELLQWKKLPFWFRRVECWRFNFEIVTAHLDAVKDASFTIMGWNDPRWVYLSCVRPLVRLLSPLPLQGVRAILLQLQMMHIASGTPCNLVVLYWRASDVLIVIARET